MDLSGKQYAQVKDRVLEFRTDCPRGSIKTTPEFLEGGDIHFTAYIMKDKADETSADATGHSLGSRDKSKDFEKLETIAVGRALALLGYGTGGEIASSEEMEEFEEHKQEKHIEAVLEWTEKLSEAKKLDALAKVWADTPADVKLELTAHKNSMKERLTVVPDTTIASVVIAGLSLMEGAVEPKKRTPAKPKTTAHERA